MSIYEPDCDDITEEGICLGSMNYCSEERRRCETADEFYHKQDGYRYFQRFLPLHRKEYCEVIDESNNGTLRVKLFDAEEAYKLCNFMNDWDHTYKDALEILMHYLIFIS